MNLTINGKLTLNKLQNELDRFCEETNKFPSEILLTQKQHQDYLDIISNLIGQKLTMSVPIKKHYEHYEFNGIQVSMKPKRKPKYC